MIAVAKFNSGFVLDQAQRLAHVAGALDGYGDLVKRFWMLSGIAAKMSVNGFDDMAGTLLDDEYAADAWTPNRAGRLSSATSLSR